MVDLFNVVLSRASVTWQDVEGIGLALPGSIHPSTKKMINGNSGIFIDQPIADDLKKLLKNDIPIELENDASCFALAEAMCGAGQEFAQQTQKPIEQHQAIGIILGTGCGGGLISNGHLHPGAHGGGGEIGHSILISGGHPCYCGRRGCAEQYLSGPAIEAAYASRIYSQIEKRPSAKEIFEKAGESEPIALAIIKDYKKHLVEFLANLHAFYDPDYFVLGGGVSLQSLVYENLESELEKTVFLKGIRPKVFQHRIGDSAGTLGAACLFF
jgi:fructokinase